MTRCARWLPTHALLIDSMLLTIGTVLVIALLLTHQTGYGMVKMWGIIL